MSSSANRTPRRLSGFPVLAAMVPALFTAFLVLAPPAFAQQGRQAPHGTTGTEIGLRGGLAFASYRGGAAGSTRKTGFHLGIFGRYKLGGGFALQPEALYVQKGADLRYSGSWKVSHDYIEVPLLLHYRVGEERLAPYVYGGPYLGILLSSFSHRSVLTADYSPDNWVQSTADTDWGGVLGVGLDWRIGPRSFLLELRYSLGLSRVYDTDLLDHRNGSLLLSLGVTI